MNNVSPVLKRLLLAISVLFCFNIANAQQWTTNGPSGGFYNGDISSLAVIGSNIFAGSDGGGVFLSTNNGGSWTAVNNGLTDLNVIAIIANGSNIFAGTNGGAFLSTNNGSSWTAVNNGLQSTSTVVYSFASIGNYIFAGIEGDGVYVSSNNGNSWAAANTGLGTIFPTSLATSGTNLYAASQYGGVYFSSDSGNSWTSIGNTALNGYEINALAVSGSNIFVGADQYGVFLSTNNGGSWNAVNTGIPSSHYNIYSLMALDTSQSVCKPSVFVGTELGGLYETANNGANWTPVDTGLPTNNYISAIAVAGSILFAGTYQEGVYQRALPSAGGSLAPPQVTVSKNEFCPNDSSQLCVPAGFSSYSWNTGATGNCLEAKQAGSYYVSVTDNSGCSAVSNTVTLSVYPAPVDSLVAAPKNVFCTGDSTSICALPGFASYQWNVAGAGNCITAKETGVYYVTVTDSHGCTASGYLPVFQDAVPVDSVVAGKKIFCANDSATVCALTGFALYQWNMPGVGTGNCITVNEAGNYYVTVTDNNGCTAESNHVSLSVYPVVTVSITERGDTLLSFGAVNYQWYLNGSLIHGATDSIYIVTGPGSYTVLITDTNGCTALSNPVSVVATGINNLANQAVRLYPNPANNSFIVEATGTGAQQLQVFDITGKLLLSQTSQMPPATGGVRGPTIDASGLAAGVYVVTLKNGTGTFTQRLVIAR